MKGRLAEIRLLLESNGISVSEWAKERGFRRSNVYAVLAGRVRCRRGEAHRIAVALGLKRPLGLAGNGLSTRQQPQTSERARDIETQALNGATDTLGRAPCDDVEEIVMT